MTDEGAVQSSQPWHSLGALEVASQLRVDLRRGLDQSEAEQRLETHGPNKFTVDVRWARLRRLGRQFQDVLIGLLLVAAVISGVLLGEWVDSFAIGAIVVLNAIIGYAQESRAESAISRLRELEAPESTVIRQGRVQSIPAARLVPGDVLQLQTGERVPADARVVQARRLMVDEAPLTGESMPVSKDEEPAPVEMGVADRSSMVHAGTTVVAGRAVAVVTSTGSDTEMGRIASLFIGDQPATPLQVEMRRVGRRLAALALIASVAIFVVGLIRAFPVDTMVLTAVAVAVAAIPEGLPAVITVTLAGGLQRMAERNALVRRFPAVEALGAVDVICTDKTGTLTAPRLEVASLVTPDGRRGLDTLVDGDSGARWLVAAAGLCNNVTRSPAGWEGDPTETALIRALEATGIEIAQLEDRFPRIDEGEFDSRRKRMSTLHTADGRFVLLLKGAPEVVVPRSTSKVAGTEVVALDDSGRLGLLEEANCLAEGGMRTMAFAMRFLDEPPDDPREAEDDLCFLALMGLRELVRPEVPDALDRADHAGIATVMVTGDHVTTAVAVANGIGLQGAAMEGRDLARISVDELAQGIDGFRVFARVDPADKVKIVRAWQSRGARVAMTGDGVNDAPALHSADIGVAMGSGTDVAREAADMVLADDNYASIVAAIAEGRRLFGNLRNVVHYLLSANVSEVVYVLIGFLAFGFLGEPLLAVQLLWINLISDAAPAVALGMDRPTRDLMDDRPGEGRDILSGRNIALLLTQGLILAGAAVAALTVGAFAFDLDQATVRTLVFTTLVFSQLLHVLSVRAGSNRPYGGRDRLSRLMIGGLVGSTALHLLVVYTEPGNLLFRTVPLDITQLSLAVVLSLASMLAVRGFNRLVSS